MDQTRFDSLARSLASPKTRRGLLGGLAALLTGLRAASAQETPCPVPGQVRNARGKCACPAGTDPCPNGCADRKRDPSNCGSCGNACLPGEVCQKGECRCPRGEVCCPEPCFGPEGLVCCDAGTFCDFGTGQCAPPAVCDASSGCLGGVCGSDCFCVSSVEGNGACVNSEFANCDAPTCEASADCGEGGICVDVSSELCCGGDPSPRVCFPAAAICQQGGAAARSAAPGWSR